MNEILTNKLDVLTAENEKLVWKLETTSYELSKNQKKFEFCCTTLASVNELLTSTACDLEKAIRNFTLRLKN